MPVDKNYVDTELSPIYPRKRRPSLSDSPEEPYDGGVSMSMTDQKLRNSGERLCQKEGGSDQSEQKVSADLAELYSKVVIETR